MTTLNADCLCDVIGIKNGLGDGVEWMAVELDDVERIEGSRRIFVEDVVLGSRTIGLKSISSVLILSGDEECSLLDEDEEDELEDSDDDRSTLFDVSNFDGKVA